MRQHPYFRQFSWLMPVLYVLTFLKINQMFRYFILLFLILLTDFSFGQVVLTQTHNDAAIGLDRKAWNGLGNTSGHSDGYHHDFTLPASTDPCQRITGISVVINLTGYTNNRSLSPYTTLLQSILWMWHIQWRRYMFAVAGAGA
jgi:hypothetical protein